MTSEKGYFKSVQEFTRKLLPQHIAGNVIDRTELFNMDSFLTGYARFCKKLGSGYSVLVPDNGMVLDEDASKGSKRITVRYIPESLQAGQLIQLVQREIVRVISIDEINKYVYLESGLNYNYTKNEPVFIYGEFCRCIGSYDRGSLSIVLSTMHKIFEGDVLRIDSTENGLWKEYTVASTIYLDQEVEDDYADNLYGYQVTFTEPLEENIVDGDWIVLRAFPAYESDYLAMPEVMSLPISPVGPYVLDWLSGETSEKVEGVAVTEVATYQIYDVGKTAITEKATLTKNTPIQTARLTSDMLLFGNVGKGYVNFDGRNLIAEIGSDNEFYMQLPLRPRWSGGQLNLWNIRVSVDADPDFVEKEDYAYVYFTAEPPPDIYDTLEFDLNGQDVTIPLIRKEPRDVLVGFRWPPNETVYYKIITPGDFNVINLYLPETDEPAEALEIFANGKVGATLRLSDITHQNNTSAFIKWSIVAHTAGRYNWGMSGLLCKQMFKTIRSLKVRPGETLRGDGPKLML